MLFIPADYEKDTKGFHRFKIRSKTGIEGTVYIPKSIEIPDRLGLRLKTAGDENKKRNNPRKTEKAKNSPAKDLG